MDNMVVQNEPTFTLASKPALRGVFLTWRDQFSRSEVGQSALQLQQLILSSTFVMPRNRKSKGPADISVSTPKSPMELVQHLRSLSQGDSRALAASSTAIALSIGSAFSNTDGYDRSSDGTTVQGRYTGWQTAYDAARMAIEITKESSDLFLPLKAVAGAISILVKNYDVSAPSLQTEHPSWSPVSCFSKHQTMQRW